KLIAASWSLSPWRRSAFAANASRRPRESIRRDALARRLLRTSRRWPRHAGLSAARRGVHRSFGTDRAAPWTAPYPEFAGAAPAWRPAASPPESSADRESPRDAH